MNPPSPQPADTLEKRRKQIEKAKAAHLSRQLQTRLQYARLKVDHGWQKQTLNEVENLYFHHYRPRIIPRSILNAEKNATAPSAQPASDPPPTSAPADPPHTSHSNPDDHREPQPPSLPVSDPLSGPNPADENAPSRMDVDPPAAKQTSNASAAPPMRASQPTSLSPSPTVVPPTPQHPPAPKPPATRETSLRPILPAPNPPAEYPAFPYVVERPPPSEFEPVAWRTYQYSSQQSAAQSGSQRPSSTRQSPSTSSSSLPGTSNAALTYDSFWSSHSSTSNSYRSALVNAASITSVGKGDGRVGLRDIGAEYPFARGTTSALKPLPLPKRPTSVARKRTVPATATSTGLGAIEGGG